MTCRFAAPPTRLLWTCTTSDMADPVVEDGVNKGPKTRAGFVATTSINRQNFGVSWNDTMDKGGILVSNTVDITIDAEAILESD